MRRGLPSRGADSNAASAGRDVTVVVLAAAAAAMGAVLKVWLFSLAGMGKANASGRLYKDDVWTAARMTLCVLTHRMLP